MNICGNSIEPCVHESPIPGESFYWCLRAIGHKDDCSYGCFECALDERKRVLKRIEALEDARNVSGAARCTNESHDLQKVSANPVAHYHGFQALSGSNLFYFNCPRCGSTLAVTEQQMDNCITSLLQQISVLRARIRSGKSPEPSQEEMYGHLGIGPG